MNNQYFNGGNGNITGDRAVAARIGGALAGIISAASHVMAEIANDKEVKEKIKELLNNEKTPEEITKEFEANPGKGKMIVGIVQLANENKEIRKELDKILEEGK